MGNIKTKTNWNFRRWEKTKKKREWCNNFHYSIFLIKSNCQKMSDVRDILGPNPRKRGHANQHLDDIEQYDKNEAKKKLAARKKYINTFSSNLIRYKTQHARTSAQAQMARAFRANDKKTFSFSKSLKAGFRDKERQEDDDSSTSAWSSSSDEEDNPKVAIPKNQAPNSSTSSEDEDNIPDLDDALEDNSVNEPANSDDKSSHEPSSINKSIFTSCDHAKFEREILQLKEENERLKNTNSKISNLDRDLLLLRKLLIAKILVNCPTEDEKNLTRLEIDNLEKTNKKLHSKLSNNQPSETCTSETFDNMWEKVIAKRDSETKKHEEVVKELQEKLSNANSKLLLQYSIRDEHEAQNKELMDILNIPDEEKSFHRFKVGLLDLKNDYGNLKNQLSRHHSKVFDYNVCSWHPC